MIKLGILISGEGSNLQAIVNAIGDGLLDARVVLVVSSRPEAYGLTRAENAGIPTLSLSASDYDDPLETDRRIAHALQEADADYVVMAGYMRKVHQPLLSAFPQRVINIHPSLLPSFPGAHGIADAFEYGVKITGVTIHFADEDYDRGPIIAQHALNIEEDDTLETLEERIHGVEHHFFPLVLQLIAREKVVVGEDNKVHIL